MITNITDQSRSIRLAATASRTCEATEKYANVNSPVVAIPMLSTRAPRPYPPRSEADKEHRPRERRPGLGHRPVARQQLHEAALRPVVEVAGRVAQLLE